MLNTIFNFFERDNWCTIFQNLYQLISLKSFGIEWGLCQVEKLDKVVTPFEVKFPRSKRWIWSNNLLRLSVFLQENVYFFLPKKTQLQCDFNDIF